MGKNSEVGKDVVITSGDIFMAEGSVIHGDLVTTSSDIGLHQAQGATIEGNTTFDIAPFAIGFGSRVLLLCCLLPVIGVIVLILILGALIGRRSRQKVKSVPVTTPVETEDTKARLQNLMNMLNDGLITQEDYEAKKAEILSKM